MSGECAKCGEHCVDCKCRARYGSAPLIFFDEDKRKEWEELDPCIRKNVFRMLHSCADKMEMKVCIEMLCNVIIDMDKRLQELEICSKK